MGKLWILTLLLFLIPAICCPSERTEAQRQYDLAVSYIKSDLYEDGLKTLNQVAFLYPDSDVADNALYQLALIREQVGNGELDIAAKISGEAAGEMARNFFRAYPDAPFMSIVAAHFAGKVAFDKEKEKAIAQYLLALDYLNTLSERYPGSEILAESKLAFARIVAKIDSLVPEPKPPMSLKGKLLLAGCLNLFALIALLLLTS